MIEAARSSGGRFPDWLEFMLNDPLTPGLLAERLDGQGVSLYQPWDAGLVGNPWRRQIHGGVLTCLLDKATRAAALAVIGTLETVVPLDLRVDHQRATVGQEGLRVHARCYRRTATVTFVEGVVRELNSGVTVATGVSSLLRVEGNRE